MSFNRTHNRNVWIDTIASGYAAFDAQRDAYKAQEAQMEAASNAAMMGGLGQGLGGFVNTFANRRAGLQDQATRQGNELAQIAAQFAGRQALQDDSQSAAMDFENLRTDNNIRQAGADQFIEDYGVTPQDYQAGIIESARTGTGGYGVPSSPAPMAPEGGSIAPGPTMMGPPSEAPLPPQIYGETPSSIPGYENGYTPKQYAQMAQLDQAYRQVQADEEIDPELKSAMTLRLAQARRNIIPGPILSKPKPPNAAEWIQQGNSAEIPDTGGSKMVFGPDGKWQIVAPASKLPPAKPATTPEEIDADMQMRVKKIDGETFIYQNDGKIDQVKGGGDGDGGTLGFKEWSSEFNTLQKNLTVSGPTGDKVPPAKTVTQAMQEKQALFEEAKIDQAGMRPVVNRLHELLRKSNALRQRGEVDMALESEIGALRKQLDAALR